MKGDISINLDDYIDLIEMLEVLDLEDNELWKKQLIEKFKLTEILFIKVKHLNDDDFNKLKIMLLFLKTPRVVILFDKNIDLVSKKGPIYEFLQEYMINMNKTIVFISNDENKLQKICGVIYIKGENKMNKIGKSFEELTQTEMMEVSGGIGPAATIVTTPSSVPCSVASAVISATGTIISWIFTH